MAQIKGRRHALGLEGGTLVYGAAFCGKRAHAVSERLGAPAGQ